jgi:hypothetical protein
MALGRKTGGRRPGSRNKLTEHERRLLEAADADDEAIVARVIAEAKAGNVAAMGLYFRFVRPAMRETFVRPVEGYTKPESVEEARERILALGVQLTIGAVSVEAHDALVGGLRVYLSDTAVAQGPSSRSWNPCCRTRIASEFRPPR